MTRHLPLVMAVIVALFLLAPIAIIVPMSFSTAVSFEFPPPGYWLGYYARYLHSAAGTATSMVRIIELNAMANELAVALSQAALCK